MRFVVVREVELLLPRASLTPQNFVVSRDRKKLDACERSGIYARPLGDIHLLRIKRTIGFLKGNEMEPNVKDAFSLALDAAIHLADVSGAEVRMIFQSMSVVVKPGSSPRKIVEESERNDRIVNMLVPLFLTLFDIADLRRFCEVLPNNEDIVYDLPSPSESRRRHVAEGTRIFCERRLIAEDFFWAAIEKRCGPEKIYHDIRSMRARVMAEFSGS